MPSFVDVSPAISDHSGFENVDTAWMDTFDRFYKWCIMVIIIMTFVERLCMIPETADI